MQKSQHLSKPCDKNMGFTLMELLTVVAIIAVLIAVAIPVFGKQLEKARSETDVHNAKTLARTVQYYLVANPDKMDEFISTYGENPRGYRPYILVTDEVLALSSDSTNIIREALDSADLLGKEIRPSRFTGLLCKSRSNWKSYSIGFTVIDGEVKIGFCGLQDKSLVARRWTFWSGADPTPFKSMCSSAGA